MVRRPTAIRTLANFVLVPVSAVLLLLLAGCTSTDVLAFMGNRLQPSATAAVSTVAATSAATPAATAAVVATIKGDAERGKALFNKGIGGAPACSSCHALAAGPFAVGPALGGLSQRAGTREPGLSAEAYLRQSILDPKAYTVSGFRPIMYAEYATHLSEQEIADLIAYLSTL